ncbi:MAG: outer membrane protein transport protein [Campylobacterota bacterium]|nr:outer membrane protein transport protein [Campylobacterota bacterium]
MKKIILLSIITSSIIHATNGDNLIALGPESRAMGGTGIAYGMGADSVFKNPAWLVDSKGLNGMFGATVFMPDVSASNAGQGNGQSATSKADMNLIPEIAITDHISNDLSYGFGMFGVSGMGVDYRNEDPMKGLSSMRTNLQYMRFVPSISYATGDWRLGAGITLSYGSLAMSAMTPDGTADPMTMAQRGGGTSEDYGFGAQIGVGYYLSNEITLGAYYQTQVDTEYENVFDFNADGMYDSLKLSQPAEYGLGIAYVRSNYGLTFDYRKIAWSSADGYDRFMWDDQDVFALGFSYEVADLTLRAGYNYSENPLSNVSTQDPQSAYFNIMGFPAFSESHYTAGFGYQLNERLCLDFAYVNSPEVTESYNGAFEASNGQNSITVAMHYTID